MSSPADDSASEPIAPTFPSPQPTRQRLGPLDCIVVDGGPKPSIPVVLCHGYGAPGHDLASLSVEWLNLLGDRGGHFRFVFPAAPLTLAEMGMPDGRAWWPLNMARLQQLAGATSLDGLYDEIPPGIDHARDALVQTLSEVFESIQSDAGRPWALGGFSQGAMLTMDTALRSDIGPPPLLLQFSGALICRPQWTQHLDRLNASRVLQSHGRMDPILPFQGAQALHEMLAGADVTATLHSFDGPHTIDIDAVAQSAVALADLVGR
ncbi:MULTISPECIES: alpha/beta hydrolase [Crateriforma]|uniref:Phospholipase/Carboxylesterase n=1 Tax=Crateriforma conspicua TaxID=2527996 RepID=A0A5C6FQD2_9PLAN|nr:MULTISPECIES: hypothetical protein [Crateriforma]TWU62788.1 Phospholipase/Carboxylesterase [Crateriforma conspicua]